MHKAVFLNHLMCMTACNIRELPPRGETDKTHEKAFNFTTAPLQYCE